MAPILKKKKGVQTPFWSRALCKRVSAPTQIRNWVRTPKIGSVSSVFIFSWDLQWSQEKLEIMVMQNFGAKNKDYYGIFDIG